MRAALALIVFLLAAPVWLSGQDLMTTPIGFRSGFSDGAVTTRPGSLTVDAGASVRWAGGTTICRVGEFNIRAPVTDRLEARLYANSYTWRQTPSAVVSGRQDLSLAAAARCTARARSVRGGGTTRYVHGGLSYLVRSWMHLDLHGGLGSRSAGSPRWIGLGVRQRA